MPKRCLSSCLNYWYFLSPTEEKSTKHLLEKMNTKLNLGVNQDKIIKALVYLEIRHLFVHSDGNADRKFCDTFPDFAATPGSKIKLDFTVLKEAKVALLELIQEYDEKVIACNLVSNNEIQS